MKRPVITLSPASPGMPEGADWRWTRWLLAGGMVLTARAALGAWPWLASTIGMKISPRLSAGFGDQQGVSLAWLGAAVFMFAAAYRGRAEHLRALLVARLANDAEAGRLQAVGAATAAFAHEVKNALTVLQGFSSMAARAAGEPGGAGRGRELIEELRGQIDKLSVDTRHFLELGGTGSSGARQSIDAAFKEIARLLGPLAAIREISLAVDAAEGVDRPVLDPDFRQALLNLGLNAVSFARSSVRLILRREGDACLVEVEDDGPGTSLGRESFLFGSLPPPRAGGHGLGLAQVRAAVEREGGSVRHERAASGGARFVVALPAPP